MKTRTKQWLFYLVAFCLPVLFFLLLSSLKNIYPWGEFSIYVDDMEIQYHDFFCFYKDVLSGKNSIEYSFYKSLGGSPIAILGYYFLSPVNLLLVFFKKSQIQLFAYIAILVKLGLCGLFSGIYIYKRFTISRKICLALSVAYAFTQYSVGQSSNIMWLDGMYMLPLIMLGIYIYVNENKPTLFYVTNALSIVFCWYTGYMNCLFAVIYYFVERALSEETFDFFDQIKKTLRFLWLELLSVLLSCALFLPVLLGQTGGRGFDKGVLKFATNGKFLDILNGFLIGSVFPSKKITLFCTVFVLLFFFSYWFSRKNPKKEKITVAFFFAIMLASLFFCPLENIWCGFKFVGSYAYRFAYLVFMVVIFISALYFKNLSEDKKIYWDRPILYGALLFIAILLFADWNGNFDQKRLWGQIFLIALYVVLIYFLTHINGCWSISIQKAVSVSATLVLIFAFGSEVLYNAEKVVGNKYSFSAKQNIDYTEEQQELIHQIQKDTGFYRVEQTTRRKNSKFYANESMAYGYRSLETYTSSYDQINSNILIALGYTSADFPSFYGNPILPADSFLGVKYLLSQNDHFGYEATEISNKYTTVRQNKYALPLGFGVATDVLSEFSYDNSFEYINELYSKSLGEKVEVVKKLTAFHTRQQGNDVFYDFDTGNIPKDTVVYTCFTNENIAAQMTLNGNAVSPYNKQAWGYWNNIVCLGSSNNIITVGLQDVNLSADQINAEFYYLDLAVFKSAINTLKNRPVRFTKFSDGEIFADYTSENAGQILLTVPIDKGWTLKVNGKKTELQSSDGKFIVVPIDAGHNTIELTFSARGKIAGATLTIVSVVLFCFTIRKKRKEKGV